MTRRHYEALAAALREHCARPQLIASVARVLLEDNERFDAEKFMAAARPLTPRARVLQDVRADMVEAHAEGWHADDPREFCPECEASRRV